MPLWLQVLLPVLTPVVAAAAALAGVRLGGLQSAGSAEQQWRRDCLLQFCVDLIVASHDMIAAARSIREALEDNPSAEPPYPHEPVQRLRRAVGSIRLLSGELAWPSTRYADATLAVVKAAAKDDAEAFKARIAHAATVEGTFERFAHDRLTGTYSPIDTAEGLEQRIGRAGGSIVTRYRLESEETPPGPPRRPGFSLLRPHRLWRLRYLRGPRD